MSRSKWKGPFININKNKTLIEKNINISLASRNSVITPNMLESTFNIHNGKEYNEITITKDMIGHKFGEFSFTRAKFIFKKNKKK